jgi:hypothetical protein
MTPAIVVSRTMRVAGPGLGLQPGRQFVGKRIKLAGRSGIVNFGSIVPALKYFAIVLRDSPVRRLIG